MKVETFRFGTLDVEEEDILRFPEGLVGLTHLRQFVLLRDSSSPDLYWLQSLDQSAFALACVHASKLGESMQRQVEREEVDLAPLKLAGPGDAEWFVVLNRVEGRATCNLRGPIVINTVRMIGRQVVLADPRFDVRHSLVAVEEPALALA